MDGPICWWAITHYIYIYIRRHSWHTPILCSVWEKRIWPRKPQAWYERGKKLADKIHGESNRTILVGFWTSARDLYWSHAHFQSIHSLYLMLRLQYTFFSLARHSNHTLFENRFTYYWTQLHITNEIKKSNAKFQNSARCCQLKIFAVKIHTYTSLKRYFSGKTFVPFLAMDECACALE